MYLDFRIPLTRFRIGTGRPTDRQKGYWVDRIDAGCTVVGLGSVLLFVERMPSVR